MVSAWSPVHLNRVLNQWYFKEGVTEVSALKVWQDSCQYLYLPRLLNSDVFVQAVTAGCASRDGFGYAAAKDGERWLGFAFGQASQVTIDADAVLISQAAAAEYQQKLDAEQRERAALQAVHANVGSAVLGAPSRTAPTGFQPRSIQRGDCCCGTAQPVFWTGGGGCHNGNDGLFDHRERGDSALCGPKRCGCHRHRRNRGAHARGV